jgi:DNA-3-methyladenine glycosylase
MRWGRKLPEPFYDRPVAEVARELVGCVLVRAQGDGQTLAGRLVEVEAYTGDGSDPSSHSHGGPSERSRSMFGPPGHLYAYRAYGIHTCVNVVCEAEGRGAAVLFRSLEPLCGLDSMRKSRGLPASASGRSIASGPGRLAQAFGFGIEDDGASLMGPSLALFRPGQSPPDAAIVAGPRIGISRARELPYRFFLAGHPLVSGSRSAARPDP